MQLVNVTGGEPRPNGELGDVYCSSRLTRHVPVVDLNLLNEKAPTLRTIHTIFVWLRATDTARQREISLYEMLRCDCVLTNAMTVF